MSHDNHKKTEKPTATQALRAYWNTLLAGLALSLHCLVFATFDFVKDGGRLGPSIFPLAPLALFIAMFCLAASFVQVLLLPISFVKGSPLRYHRLVAIILAWGAIGLIFVAGQFGWFIRV